MMSLNSSCAHRGGKGANDRSASGRLMWSAVQVSCEVDAIYTSPRGTLACSDEHA